MTLHVGLCLESSNYNSAECKYSFIRMIDNKVRAYERIIHVRIWI